MNDFDSPTIRLAQVSDASELKNLNDVFNDNDDTTLDELETSLRENSHELIICADAGSMIVGICCIQIMRTMCFNWKYAYITEIFVREECRNRGIGTLLIKFAEQELLNKGIKKIQLLVGEQNTKAQKLYQSLGFNDVKGKTYMKDN